MRILQDARTLSKIQRCRSEICIKKALLDAFKGKPVPKDASKLRIVILNAPCNGFGDLIFAYKLQKLLYQWYNIKCKIATTQPKALMTLGVRKSDILSLRNKSPYENQCLLFSHVSGKLGDFDLLFVAPMIIDRDPSLKEIAKLDPRANSLNTYFFSEYNDYVNKYIDFNMGIGGSRLGMFLDAPKKTTKMKSLTEPYYMLYLNDQYETPHNGLTTEECAIKFIEMVCAKNAKSNRKLSIVAPKFLLSTLEELSEEEARKVFGTFTHVVIVTGDKI